uniref:Deoxyuridine 5'-triphosphate nucleotidohydrolase n=1 Tax=Parascaris univalens TaxID=6257 RepID=A0A915BF84_PARUN
RMLHPTASSLCACGAVISLRLFSRLGNTAYRNCLTRALAEGFPLH